MIFVNLLPPELKVKETRKLNIPYRPIAAGIFLVFLVLAIYNLTVYIRVRREYRTVEREWAGLADRSAEADALERELGTSILAEVDFYDSSVDPKLETARVMNLVSDFVPQVVWLTQVKFVRMKREVQLVLQGSSESFGKSSRLIEIQNFANKLKDQMEHFLGAQTPQDHGVRKPVNIALTTSSQKGSAPESELTLFTATFETGAFSTSK